MNTLNSAWRPLQILILDGRLHSCSRSQKFDANNFEPKTKNKKATPRYWIYEIVFIVSRFFEFVKFFYLKLCCK